jgi:hypothetical protein
MALKAEATTLVVKAEAKDQGLQGQGVSCTPTSGL